MVRKTGEKKQTIKLLTRLWGLWRPVCAWLIAYLVKSWTSEGPNSFTNKSAYKIRLYYIPMQQDINKYINLIFKNIHNCFNLFSQNLKKKIFELFKKTTFFSGPAYHFNFAVLWDNGSFQKIIRTANGEIVVANCTRNSSMVLWQENTFVLGSDQH